jgi:hypothetical protein
MFLVRRIPGALLVSLFALGGPAAAEPHRTSIRGLVSDASGAALAGAQVSVVALETNATRAVVADQDGRFVVALLPPGAYRLRIEAPGHRPHVEALTLRVNEDLRADVQLLVGGLAEEVVVSAPLAALRRETAALGTVVDNRQIMSLPLDGRNFLELALLAPGAVPAAEGSASSVRGDFAFSVNGAREDANGFVLDGVDNVDPKLNTPAVRPAVDAIREFEVLTSTYEAPLGRYSGAQVNVVLKSGTNALHGTGYGFFRTDALDARNAFAPGDQPAPDYRRQQFGFSLGGPLLRDRLFLFGNYEGTRVREGITRVTNVPTAAERAGDFSRSLLPPPTNPFTGQPFPGNQVPVFFQNPVGRAIAALYPLPNRDVPFQNYVSSPNQDDANDQFDVRLDKALGERVAVSGRYSFADRRLFEPFGGAAFPQVPGFGNDVARRAQNLAVGVTQTISPRLLNEVRFGFTRVSSGVFHQGQGRSLNREVGLPELSANPRDWGLSYITVAGYSPLGHEYNNPQQGTTDAFQVVDTLTWTRGAHLVRAGVDVRAVRQEAYRDVQSRGFLAFSSFPGPSITGNALADLLLGFPLFTGGAQLDNPQRLRTTNYGIFVHDNWRVRPSVTLSAGLRYDYSSPAVDAENRASLYDPATRQLLRVGQGGLPRGGYDPDRNNFAPRLGATWTPGASGLTVVRGGYGVFYGQSALAPSEGLYFSPPYYDFDSYFFLPFRPLTLNDPFPADFPIRLPDRATAIQRDLRTPYMQHWNVSVQRQLGPSRAAEIAYVGSRGSGLLTARDLNEPLPSPTGLPRPDRAWDEILYLESAGRSNYHALQARFDQRMAGGASLLAAYTFGKSLDDGSGFFPSTGDPNLPQNSRDRSAEYGRSGFDVRHRLSVSVAWDLPSAVGRDGLQGALLSGWQLAGIVTLQAGRPFTVALLPDFDNSNTGRSSLGFGANDRPNLVGDPRVDNPSAERWFNTAAFAVPPRGSFGDAGRNILEGPGYANVNAALAKRVPLTGRAHLDVRLEAFNLLNRVNYDGPDPYVGSPTFGQVLSAGSPRRMQLGGRLVF